MGELLSRTPILEQTHQSHSLLTSMNQDTAGCRITTCAWPKYSLLYSSFKKRSKVKTYLFLVVTRDG